MFSKTNYRIDIQVLRGLAVIAVVAFHTNENFFPLGYLGVDIFFVISGFVVTPLILRIFTEQLNKRKYFSNLWKFYERRFYRLSPALAVMLIFTLASLFLLGPISDHYRFASQGIATLLLLGNAGAYKYSGDYFSQNPNPLIHTWSLSVEEQIYLVLPLSLMLILFFCRRVSLKKITSIFFGIILAVSFVSFLFPSILEPLYSIAGINLPYQISFYSPIDRIWQFTAGSLVYLTSDRLHNRLNTLPRRINSLIIFSALVILFGSLNLNLKLGSILASLFAIIIIYFRSLAVLPNFLIHKLEWVGDRSYSIYLAHLPLLYLAKHSPVTQTGISQDRGIATMVAVFFSVLLGDLSYSKIENRFRIAGKKKSIGHHYTLKAFAFFFILPLIVFLLLYSTTTTPMDQDRLDNGMCKFWTPTLDENFYARFLNCHSKMGGATVILGDSHAMNIYNSLYITTQSEFFVGISTGGCRPNTKADSCFYDDFEKFLESTPDSIDKVVFHQSGSYLISDENGSVDSSLAFESQKTYRILDYEIEFLLNYLNKLGRKVPTVWIGPFAELRIDPSWLQVKSGSVQPNPFVKEAFLDLEKQIDYYLKNDKNTFQYISLSKALGSSQFEFKVGGCIIFRDIDHWSECAEEMFSLPISKILHG